jgi:hypothetical protein
VGGEVCAAVGEASARAGEDQLRADTVGRGCEQPLAVQRVQTGEGAEPAGPGRLDGGT